MVRILDIIRLKQLFLSDSSLDLAYAFAGGVASQCWLNRTTNDRKHHDVDVFAFNADILKAVSGIDSDRIYFYIGGFSQEDIIAGFDKAPIQLEIIRGKYFDAEVIPTVADVRQLVIYETSLPVLSPEFIVVSKLSYPNVHRLCDFHDVLALSQCEYLQGDSEYVSSLLAQTSLGKLIDAESVLGLKTQNDLQNLVDFIHCQLIRRFLHWDYVNVDALNPLQIFVLLDMKPELFSLSSEVLHFIDAMIADTTLRGREVQIARLGLHFLTMGIPNHSLDLLERSDFQTLIHRALFLITEQPSFWLARFKTIFAIMQQLACVVDSSKQKPTTISNSNILLRIVQRVLFEDPSRFVLVSAIQSIYHDLKIGRISTSDCTHCLHEILMVPCNEASVE